MKKSKWILKLTLSIITMMLAAEVLAKGGGHPGSPAGTGRDWHFVTVTPKWNARVANRHHFAAMSPQAPRASLNMNRQELRKQKRQNKKQCISSCIESFGTYYDVASFLSPWGLVGGTTFIISDVLGDYSEDSLRRRGNRNQWSGNYRRGTWLVTAANGLRFFNGLALIGGGVGLITQQGMQIYCRKSKCKKA